MIDKKEVIEFFNHCAPSWDAELIKSDKKINTILDNAGVGAGSLVLDVACGTGVMIPYYLGRKAGFVAAIDISPEMIKIAREKYAGKSVNIICKDVETISKEELLRDTNGSVLNAGGFDAVVVYNAFPHFPDPERLIKRLSEFLAPGGRLTVAHGMSREAIDAHHKGGAGHISNGLMPAEDLAEIFRRYLSVTTVISDSEMYQVAGVK